MSSSVYYNENDPFVVLWLHELMKDGLIPEGRIDDRSIEDVSPDDLRGYDQCHFFAGIGGWPEAFRLAGWEGPAWTGSCPCQPFSTAGKGKGFKDSRHLWPAWFRLIRECRPPVVFGEQVASKDGLGWIDTVSTDLEAEGYAFGAADISAGGVGADHKRQRLIFVAHTESSDRQVPIHQRGSFQNRPESGGSGPVGPLADTERQRNNTDGRQDAGEQSRNRTEDGLLGRSSHVLCTSKSSVALGDTDQPRLEGRRIDRNGSDQRTPWEASVAVECLDGRSRRIPPEPSLFPLASGVQNRMGLVCGERVTQSSHKRSQRSSKPIRTP